jgi:hypothetical protein
MLANYFDRKNQYKVFKTNYLCVIFSMCAVVQTDFSHACRFKTHAKALKRNI